MRTRGVQVTPSAAANGVALVAKGRRRPPSSTFGCSVRQDAGSRVAVSWAVVPGLAGVRTMCGRPGREPGPSAVPGMTGPPGGSIAPGDPGAAPSTGAGWPGAASVGAGVPLGGAVVVVGAAEVGAPGRVGVADAVAPGGGDAPGTTGVGPPGPGGTPGFAGVGGPVTGVVAGGVDGAGGLTRVTGDDASVLLPHTRAMVCATDASAFAGTVKLPPNVPPDDALASTVAPSNSTDAAQASWLV